MASANEVARKIVGDYIVALYGVPSISIYDRAKGAELVQAIEKALKDEREECAKEGGRERRDYELASVQSAFPAAAQAQLKDQARVLAVVEAKVRARA